MHKLVKLIIDTNNKKCELKTYNKVINNSIYRNKWKAIIDKKL